MRLSIAAGADLTPLIHFWGIHPVNPSRLRDEIIMHGLGPSEIIRDRLLYYAGIAPHNNTEFNAHFERIHPGRPLGGHPDYGHGWYNEWRDVYNEGQGEQIDVAIQDLIDLYYPPGRVFLPTL